MSSKWLFGKPRKSRSAPFPNYLKILFRRAGSESWDVVFADRPVTVVIGLIVACLLIYLQRRSGVETPAQVRDALISGGIGLATWVFVFLATFLVHFLYFTPKHQSVEIKEERDSFETQLESLRDLTAQRRQEQREQMGENCVKMLKAQKIGMLAFHAIARHEAYKLESEDLDWVCDEIQKFYGFHPFADLDAYVPPKDRKEFLRWVCLSPDYIAHEGIDYLNAAERWRHDHGYPLPPEKDRIAMVFSKTISPEG